MEAVVLQSEMLLQMRQQSDMYKKKRRMKKVCTCTTSRQHSYDINRLLGVKNVNMYLNEAL